MPPRRSQSGFTLLELLVVLVIMGLLVSMVTINTNVDRNKNRLEQSALKIKFYLEALAEEAVMNNATLGIEVSDNKLQVYRWTQVIEEQDDAQASLNIGQTNNDQPKYQWSEHQSRYQWPELDEDMYLSLELDGQTVVLETSTKEEDIEPQIQMFSTGEQSLSTITLHIDQYNKQVSIQGFGVGRYYTSEVEQDL
ncbi:type II secretion system minor pseudopilin GspH [Bermanella sp. R86510]|uniref:type II secretion system minor pseudopilin GspH n=1 Tax=unclassified Bermanella TaxID=2627862 RepID=UPI0037C7F215